jgi:ATP-dependent Clp protease ATP-binding subunit ClpA
VFERFTDEARQVVIGAQEEGRRLRAERIEPVHLLLALTRSEGAGGDTLRAVGIDHPRLLSAVQRNGTALDGDALAAVGIDLTQVRAATEAAFGPGALDGAGASPRGHLYLTDGSKQALAHSVRLGSRRRSPSIDSACLLFGVLSTGDRMVGRVLRQLGTDPDVLRDRAAA